MRKKIKTLGLTLVAVVVAGFTLTIPTTAYADVIQEDECFPAVLMLRGSGETPPSSTTYRPVSQPNLDYIATNGHEGGTIARLLQGFVNDTDPAETVSKVRFIGVDYPALPVPPPVVDTSGMSGSEKVQWNL